MASFDIRRLFSIPVIYDLFQDVVGANALKARFIRAYCPSDRPVRVLEIGCGPGKNLDYMPPNVEYVGCDLSKEYIAHAEKKYGHKAKFYCLSVADMGELELDKFDVVMCMGVLHHLSDDLVGALCRETERLLKPGGIFLAQEPCWTPDQSWINRTIMSYDRGEDIRDMDGYTELMKRTFAHSDAHLVETDDIIIFPTRACAVRAGNPAQA